MCRRRPRPIQVVMRSADATSCSAPPTPRRRRWSLRRRDRRVAVDDNVVIADEAGYAWWAGRDHLEQVPTRHERDPGPGAFAEATAFAAADPGQDPEGEPSGWTAANEAEQTWNEDSLYEWAAGTHHVVDDSDESGEGTPAAWLVLGLTADTGWPEVARRHRILAKRYHPDLHAGSDEGARRRAEERMAEINTAFDELSNLYGRRRGA